MIYKTVFKKMIDLKTGVSIKKIIIALIFEIDSTGIYIIITLINQNIIVLLQIVLLELQI